MEQLKYDQVDAKGKKYFNGYLKHIDHILESVLSDLIDKGQHSQSLQCSRQVQRFESLFILAGEGHF